MKIEEKVQRAKDLLKDPVLVEILDKMEERALDDFLAAHRWWWGDRRRRLAAEQLREVREFRRRLRDGGTLRPQRIY